jgi:hypothetical protein
MSTRRRPSQSGQHGYLLLDMLIATAISCALLGVLLQFAASALTAAGVQADAADLQQRLRVALESIRHDLMLAGAGPSHGGAGGPLVHVFAPVLPARTGLSGADGELTFRPDRLSAMYVPDGGAQTTVSVDMAGALIAIAIDGAAPGCSGPACGFGAGDDVLIYEPTGAGGAHEVFSVASVDGVAGTLTASAPLSRAYRRGARVAAIVQRIYYWDRSGKRLMVYDGAGSDLPLVDHVVDLRFTYFADPRADAVRITGAPNCVYTGSPPTPLLADLGGSAPKALSAAELTDGPACGEAPFRFDGDLLRLRRVSVTIRLEAESAQFRGTAGAFANAGFARSSAHVVADLQATIDVAPRNMSR